MNTATEILEKLDPDTIVRELEEIGSRQRLLRTVLRVVRRRKREADERRSCAAARSLRVISPELKATFEATKAEPKLLLTQPESWRYLGVSRSRWFRLRSSDSLPAPVSLGDGEALMWRKVDLDRWVERLRPARRKRHAES